MKRSSALRMSLRLRATRAVLVHACTFAVVVLASHIDNARASTDSQDCLSAIFSAASKFAQCGYKAEAKYFKSLDRPKQVADSASCEAKLHSSIEKAYDKFGAACPDRSISALAATRDVNTASQSTSSMVEDELTFALKWTGLQLVLAGNAQSSIYPLGDPHPWSLWGEAPKIIVRPTPKLHTSEAGETATFAVMLSKKPEP